MAPRFVLKESKWNEDRTVLIDTKTEKVVACDRGEPEDNSFDRDWAKIPDLLNSLADEIEKAGSCPRCGKTGTRPSLCLPCSIKLDSECSCPGC